MSSPTPMPTFAAGLAPMEGIPMVAQAMLHREILHVHASLNLILHVLRSPFAILDTRHLSSSSSTTSGFGGQHPSDTAGHLHCSSLHFGVVTTFGLMHATRFDSAQLAAELRGHASFPHPRIFPPTSSFSIRTTTSASQPPLATPLTLSTPTTGSEATDDIFRTTAVPRAALSHRMD